MEEGSEVKHLSIREQQVLELALKGLRNKEIGAKLNVTEKTVKFHMTMIFKKYKVHSRGQLFAKIFNGGKSA